LDATAGDDFLPQDDADCLPFDDTENMMLEAEVRVTGSSTSNNKLCYTFLMSRCGELCRAAAHDKKGMAAVVAIIDECTERLRRRLHITPTWADIPSCAGQAVSSRMPLAAIPTSHPCPATQKRFRSGGEIQRLKNRKRKAAPSSNHQGMDHTWEPVANVGKRNKSCSLCSQAGHQVRSCPSLECYNGLPLPKNDQQSRNDLSMSLSQPNQYATGHRDQEDIVFNSLPKNVEALILNRRKFIDNTLFMPNIPSNFCVEITILHNGGVKHERYTRKLFEIGCVGQFVQKSKNNIIISELKSSSSHDVNEYAMVGAPTYINPGYLTQLSLSQVRMSQQTESNFSTMGYGIDPYGGHL
jgi:hypothetical protein